MLKLAKIAALMGVTAVLCGFNATNFIFDINAYRGESVRDAIARLGPPVHRGHNGRWTLYYWHTPAYAGDFVCKIWGEAERGIIINWGYRDCAY